MLHATILLAAACALSPQDTIREEFESHAQRIPCLPLGCFLYDRSPEFELRPRFLTTEESTELDRFWSKRRSYPRAELIALAKHPEAKVRQLALCALYSQENPRDLPMIRALVSDEAQGFRAYNPVGGLPMYDPTTNKPYPAEKIREWSLGEPLTVGDVAEGFVSTYLAAAHYHYGIEGSPSNPGWETYWDEHSKREHCLSWFRVALQHATTGTTPFQEKRLARVRELRSKIDGLASPYREWILIWLARPEEHPLVSGEERVALAKRIGAESLMTFLRGEAPTDDPDMLARSSNDWDRAWLIYFLLENATELKPEHAEELLALDRKHFKLATSGDFSANDSRWAIAAAKLQPERGEQILLDALDRYDAPHMFAQEWRARLIRALWELRGMEALVRVLDWYYGEVPPMGSSGLGRQRFTSWIRDDEHELLRAILLDARLDTLDWVTLEYLVRTTNRVAKRDIVSENELRKIWHPYGASHFHAWREKGLREHPAQTKAVDAQLAELRAKLRSFAQGN